MLASSDRHMANIGGNRAGSFFFVFCLFFCQSLIWPQSYKASWWWLQKVNHMTSSSLAVCWPSTDPRTQAWVWTATIQHNMASPRPSQLRVHREEQHKLSLQHPLRIRLKVQSSFLILVSLVAVLELSLMVHDINLHLELGSFFLILCLFERQTS